MRTFMQDPRLNLITLFLICIQIQNTARLGTIHSAQETFKNRAAPDERNILIAQNRIYHAGTQSIKDSNTDPRAEKTKICLHRNIYLAWVQKMNSELKINGAVSFTVFILTLTNLASIKSDSY